MRIGMVCYASLGGSGVVATELGRALAGRGHEVHLISSEPPFRWRPDIPRLSFEPVVVPSYPLFREPQYLLALATTIARIAESKHLDIVHAHYAVPHATAAYLADQMLMSSTGLVAPRTMTTLHGTDITLIGSDPSYARVVAFSIEQSDGVTAVSESLKADSVAALGVRRPIRVIPNFLDCSEYRRQVDPQLRAQVCPSGTQAVIAHMSNFRPVKRLDSVVEVFRRVRQMGLATRLLLIGDGPVRPDVEQMAANYGLIDDVIFAGEQQDPVRWLSVSDLFLLPSEQESFGLAALEAMACEVPVIASNAGGLPEIVEHGVTGFISPVGAADKMAQHARELIEDPGRGKAMGRAAAEMVRTRYCTERIVPLYEHAYDEVLSR